MKRIVAYLLVVLGAISVLLILEHILSVPAWYSANILFAKCAYVGALGGVLYLLRAVYLRRCVHDDWDDKWQVWYYLRPVTSAIAGGISCIFLKAGLLVVEASSEPGAMPFGYLAVAFIAGYNVDNFMRKIESTAKNLWGIKETRASSEKDSGSEKNDGPSSRV